MFLFSSTLLSAEVDYEKKILSLEKSLKKMKKKLNFVKRHDAKDNIKWGIDFRTSLDSIEYKSASGKLYKNKTIFSNRLWLNMGYSPVSNMIFKGTLSYNKAYGATPINSITNFPQRGYGLDKFDWVLNENLLDDTIRLKEAYWLYLGETMFGKDIRWTASIGRRPTTNGFLVNLRDNDRASSSLGHNVNIEFDGASFKVSLDELTDIEGLSLKTCFGRAVSNARARFYNDGNLSSMGDYSFDDETLKDVDLAGFIAVLFNDGQYKVKADYFRAFDVPGYKDDFSSLKNLGDMDELAVSALVDGVGDDINDFLNHTKVFASFALSKTMPDSKVSMLDSFDDEVGTSYWLGAQWPCFLVKGARVGAEYNHGSKYWRPFTYGEDTLVGSKLAVRGDAYELYWSKILLKSFSVQLRYTKLKYNYTGSQGFFGAGGAVYNMAEAKSFGLDTIKNAEDIRIAFRYRF